MNVLHKLCFVYSKVANQIEIDVVFVLSIIVYNWNGTFWKVIFNKNAANKSDRKH